jgi:hypothetical protein
VEIEPLGFRRRMEPPHRREVGVFPASPEAIAALPERLRGQEMAGGAAPPGSAETEAQAPRASAGELAEEFAAPVDADAEEADAWSAAAAGFAAADPAERDAEGEAASAPDGPATAVSSVETDHAPEEGTAAGMPGGPGLPPLHDYVADLTPLDARWPRRADLSLAVDREGRLHLLAAAVGDDPLALFHEMLAARQWAIDHADLLALSARQYRVDRAATPAVHLFTDRPKALLRLLAAGDPDRPLVQLHLLQPVEAGDATAWSHAELV